MADQERRKEYKIYLEDMDKKLKGRPLLFERESQTNARNKAHKRYEEILRDAGIEGNTLDSFLQGDVDASSNGNYDSDNDDGSYVDEKNSDDGITEDDRDNTYDGGKISNDDGDDISNDGSYTPIHSMRTRSAISDSEEEGGDYSEDENEKEEDDEY